LDAGLALPLEAGLPLLAGFFDFDLGWRESNDPSYEITHLLALALRVRILPAPSLSLLGLLLRPLILALARRSGELSLALALARRRRRLRLVAPFALRLGLSVGPALALEGLACNQPT
jgi:hypothetical protein